VDTTRGEWVEKELNVLIERRHDQRVKTEGERTAEELWKESERRYIRLKRWRMQAEHYRFEMNVSGVRGGRVSVSGSLRRI
jgi:hypothetical protein